MELLDLLDSSVTAVVTELEDLRQENKELQSKVSGSALAVADMEELRLENEELKAKSSRDDQLGAANVDLQVENIRLQSMVDELNDKIEAHQSEFVALKDELIQEHKVKDLVLDRVNILLNRLDEIKK